ncbi:phosphotransferase family protein [Bacillus salitolerans]|uniref:Phosphotransferase family protein n=1 Tax=Bacillus salitolerans TaxID=1437434 RepID=A0ABW4LL25_9BACI
MKNKLKQAEELEKKLIQVINKSYHEWDTNTLCLAGYGVENAVFKIENMEKRLFAIRVPWNKRVLNDNEGEFDSRIQLQKEAEIASHCFKYGLPVPEVIHLHLDEDIDFLVSHFIRGDQNPTSSYEIGLLTSKLHQLPINKLRTIDSRKMSKILSERITNRFEVFKRITSVPIEFISQKELETILQHDDDQTCLLHMDIRPANLISENGQIKAIVDWNNALIGNPVLDVMRTVETNEVDETEFLKGYGKDEMIDITPRIIRLIYRLDTAVMLAVLFLSYLQDKEKGEYYTTRVQSLCKSIIMDFR